MSYLNGFKSSIDLYKESNERSRLYNRVNTSPTFTGYNETPTSIALLEADGDEGAAMQAQAAPVPNQDNNDFNIQTSFRENQPPREPGIGNPPPSTANSPTVPEDNLDMGDGELPPEEDPAAEVDTEAKQKDRELFASMTPQEQKMKIVKLKESYKELYERIGQIIEKYDAISLEFEDYGHIIKKSLDVLNDLKSYIADYMLELFDSKSYIENDVMFNRYLIILNTIKKTTDEMCKQKKKEIDNANKEIKLL